MNYGEICDMTKMMVADDRYDGVIEDYVDVAMSSIVARLYPYSEAMTWDDVPTVFHDRAALIAAYLISKRGAEGEVSHRENGTSREWGSAHIPSSFFYGMVPHCGVPR